MVERILYLNREKAIFWSLLSILLVAVGFYMYFINTTVRNVVASQDLEAKIAQLNLSISSKEFQYINNRNAVTLNLAYSMGFKDVLAKTYINEKSTKEVSFLSN
ncbi:MAG: hypothetical protein CEO12_77 [Parcubacteria group bacterium Gr01-1014_46]|nr:MAG: hypothetical protein CEO12_77 [Parcubacteria group bacterium Gr01-1014_46]